MKNCPIGLICEHFDCRPQICNDYANPVELPYQVWSEDGIYPQGTLVCQLPELRDDWDWKEPEYVSINRSHYNVYTDRIRALLQAEGWGGHCELPYSYDAPKKALLVNCTYLLKDTDLDLDTGVNDCNPTVRGFAPALPIDLHFAPRPEEIERDLEPDGFCGRLLLWDDYYEFDM